MYGERCPEKLPGQVFDQKPLEKFRFTKISHDCIITSQLNTRKGH